jgi:hypothetical protein
MYSTNMCRLGAPPQTPNRPSHVPSTPPPDPGGFRPGLR